MKKNVTFLIGSGLSVSVGLPSVDQITREIFPLNLESVYKSSNNHFYKGNQPDKKLFPEYFEYNETIHKVLSIFDSEIKEYYTGDHNTNYEDLFYLASQTSIGEFDNPTILEFIKKLRKEIEPFLSYSWSFDDIIYNTLVYIQDMLWALLSKKPVSLANLNLIVNSIDNRIVHI